MSTRCFEATLSAHPPRCQFWRAGRKLPAMESVSLPPRVRPAKLLIPALVGAAVAVGLGVYGHEHDPTGESIFSLVFTKTINMKAWFATGALTLAVFQVLTAMRMYGKLPVPRTMPRWLPLVHRLSGTGAFLLTVPVAYHCLWALGFQDNTTRVHVHSILGCCFFGAFAAKVIVVESLRAFRPQLNRARSALPRPRAAPDDPALATDAETALGLAQLFPGAPHRQTAHLWNAARPPGRRRRGRARRRGLHREGRRRRGRHRGRPHLDAPDLVALEFGEPHRSVRPGDDLSGLARGARERKLGDPPSRRHPPDLAGIRLGEPQRSVLTEGDSGRFTAGRAEVGDREDRTWRCARSGPRKCIVNHSAPPEAAIPEGPLPGTSYSMMLPLIEIAPILFAGSASVNQSRPSGPGVMSPGTNPAGSGYSVIGLPFSRDAADLGRAVLGEPHRPVGSGRDPVGPTSQGEVPLGEDAGGRDPPDLWRVRAELGEPQRPVGAGGDLVRRTERASESGTP